MYKLYDWARYSLLRFHPDKCVVMRYTMNARNDTDETRLKTDIGEKELGNLSFAEHIASKVKKATYVAGLIRRSFTYLDKYIFRTLFTTIVQPHLEYGAPIWNPHSKRLIELIENVQWRVPKIDP